MPNQPNSQPNKATVKDLIDGITGGTADLFKKTEGELYKQRLQLENLYKQSPIAAKIEQGVREATAAKRTAEEILKSEMLKHPEKFRRNFIQKSLKDLKEWSGKNIIEPLTKALDKNVVKPLSKTIEKNVAKPLAKVANQTDKLVSKTVRTVLKPLTDLAAKTSVVLKVVTKELPEITAAAKGFLKIGGKLAKVLPFIGLLIDLLTAQSIVNAIEAQKIQLKKLDVIYAESKAVNERTLLMRNQLIKMEGKLAAISNELKTTSQNQKSGSSTLTSQDAAKIAAIVVAQLKPSLTNSQQRIDFSPVTTQLSQIQARLNQPQPAKVDLTPVTAQLSQIQARVNQPQSAKVDLTPVTVQLSQIQAKVNQITLAPVQAQLNQIQSTVGQPPKVDFTQVLGSIAGVSAAVVTVNAGIGALNTKLNRPLVNPTDLAPVLNRMDQVDQNVLKGTQKITQVETAVATNTANVNQLKTTVDKGLAPIQGMAKTIDTVDDKLGTKIPGGGIGGKLTRLAEWLHLDRVLNVLTYVNTLYNAYMLSNGLTQTLFSMISNVLAAVGIKDAEGSPLDIGAVIGKTVDAFAKSVLGVATVDGIKAEWKKYNRIYQAASNLLWSIQSISQSILGALEIVGSMVAKIGNALKRFGAIGEKAFGWMNTTPNYQNRFFTALEKVEGVVSNVDSIAGEILSVQDTVTQMGTQKTELEKSLKQDENTKQGKESPEAAKLKETEEKAKADSKSPTIPPEAERKPE
jgi:hypothetical protein